MSALRGFTPSESNARSGLATTARGRACGSRVLLMAACALVLASGAGAQTRVRDLTTRPGDVPRRLLGYGIVVGLEGTGDANFGGSDGATPSVRSVTNLLRRFDIEVPPDQLRMRNVAAVLVTAEVSPYLRSGGRFEVQVSALADATSLRGGVLWITPLVTDPDQPPVATAQGPLYIPAEGNNRYGVSRRGNSARIPQGGVLEADPPPAPLEARLLLREPDLVTAGRIAASVNSAFGGGSAKVEDPGSVALTAWGPQADNLIGFLAAVDTLVIDGRGAARIVIDSRDGTVVAGGDIQVGMAVVSHRGLTLQIGGIPVSGDAQPKGLVHVEPQATVQDVAAGLHAAGARPDEVAAIFDALRSAGAIGAPVTIR